MDFPVKYKSERDVEIPLLIDFIKKCRDIDKVLDVGCARSIYLKQVRKLVRIFECIDMEFDKKANLFLDNYFIGDVTESNLGSYDLVFAISVIEHYGVKQRPASCPLCSQKDLVKKIASLAKKYVFLSFPYGQGAKIPGEFSVIANEELVFIIGALKEFALKVRFFGKTSPGVQKSWLEISQKRADQVVYDGRHGVTCVCIVEGEKKNV